jgi:hypothetical protein
MYSEQKLGTDTTKYKMKKGGVPWSEQLSRMDDRRISKQTIPYIPGRRRNVDHPRKRGGTGTRRRIFVPRIKYDEIILL